MRPRQRKLPERPDMDGFLPLPNHSRPTRERVSSGIKGDAQTPWGGLRIPSCPCSHGEITGLTRVTTLSEMSPVAAEIKDTLWSGRGVGVRGMSLKAFAWRRPEICLSAFSPHDALVFRLILGSSAHMESAERCA